ncbi:glutaredoxin 3 [Gellertiella hungarica]|uniref:Glutaredoxin n=1 Tax=Gellertiella hungarica TaxID=1572859 RepID=A0A7W6J5J9_9HYPH|nr:glutaredoxin 3 [Gellertiella hungarica]MBB4065187.1 glutaredoxin 3 [Gellertiella hungarica]
MADVIIYTRDGCPYCTRAKALLSAKGAGFTEYNASHDPSYRQQMVERSGRNTFPQVFVNGQHLGGCDDIHALDAQGKLDPLLARGA